MFYILGVTLKKALLIFDFVVFTLLMYLLAWLPGFITRRFYPKLFRSWCWSFIRALGVDLRLHQKHHKALPERYILIANHPSAFEDIGIPALFPVFSLAKIEVKKWFIVGRISRAAGTLYDNSESRDSRQEASQAIDDALKNGKNIALYPEGGCKGRRIFESFRYGAFDISQRTGVPIVPVFLHYEAQQDFEWQEPHTLLDKLWHFMTTPNSRVNYYVYDAIDPTKFTDKIEYNQYVYDLYLKWQEKYLD